MSVLLQQPEQVLQEKKINSRIIFALKLHELLRHQHYFFNAGFGDQIVS